MLGIFQVLEFVFLFSFLVIAHEFGHFLAARLSKINVEEFGLGYPPKLLKLFTIAGTEFTINALPFGGFVRLRGELSETEDGFQNTKPLKRIFVLLGGPLTNILMAIILFSFVYASIGVPDSDKTIIANVIANSPADVIGLESGDLIVAIDGHQVRGKSDVLDIVLQNSNDYYLVDVLRDGSEYSFEVTKRDKIPVGEGPLGIQISNPVRRVSIFQSLAGGVITAYEQIHYTISVPFLIANGDITADEARPVGPVGIYDLFDQVKNEDALALSDADSSLGVIWFLAAISLAIGVTNLLPIPALDGGQILLTLPELFVGKKIPIRAVKVINATGFALLMALLVYVTFQDFFHLIP